MQAVKNISDFLGVNIGGGGVHSVLIPRPKVVVGGVKPFDFKSIDKLPVTDISKRKSDILPNSIKSMDELELYMKEKGVPGFEARMVNDPV